MFQTLRVGDLFTWEMEMNKESIDKFRELSLDDNPLHTDSNYAKACGFSDSICYGNLLGFMISSIVGVRMKHYHVMLISQNILYKKPFYQNDKIVLQGTVEFILEALSVAELRLLFLNQDGKLIAQGKCKVKKI